MKTIFIKWSEEEIRYLKENSSDLSRKIIAKHLGRTTKAVEDKVYKMGLYKTGKKLLKPPLKAEFNPSSLYGCYLFLALMRKIKNHTRSKGMSVNINLLDLKNAFQALKKEVSG